MMSNGYAGKILKVNLGKGSVSEEHFTEELRKKYIGGSGLGARILFDETGPDTDPLGPDNIIAFLTGPVSGTPFPTSGRHTIVAKSPLTGIWGEGSTGGTWGTALKQAGYDAIVIYGKSPEPVYIWINDGKVELRSAKSTWGQDTFETNAVLKKETDPRASVACIGPAGERLVKLSNILHDGSDARSGGRCGLGAVMGSKLLKAVAVRGTKRPDIYDREGLLKSIKAMLPTIKELTEALANHGTACGVSSLEEIGDLPIKNWLQGRWAAGAQKISGQAISSSILTGRYSCMRCNIGCGRRISFNDSRYGMVEGKGPEYESVASLGSLCLVDDIKAVSKASDICNRYGIDTIGVGTVIAFAMEAYEKGLINKAGAGMDLEWGNPSVLVRLTEMIAEGTGIGDILGRGVQEAAEIIGGNSQEFAAHVKGLALPAHDPRAYYSIAVGYSTSNRGACHLQGLSHLIEKTTTMPEIGYPKPLNPFTAEGKGVLTAKMQDLMAIFDAVCICKFLMFGGFKLTHLTEWLNLVTGWDLNTDDLMKTGECIFNLKRMYNVKNGISRKDDTLPWRILTHRRGEGGAATALPPLGEMLSDYYDYRGWSEDGIPTKDKLKELDLI